MSIDTKCSIEDGDLVMQFRRGGQANSPRPFMKAPVVLTVADVTCHGCRQIATLGDGRLCEFCRRPAAAATYGLIARVRDLFRRGPSIQFSKNTASPTHTE